MDIEFRGSPRPTLGVEVELSAVDRETRALAAVASDVLQELGQGHDGGEHPKAKHELFQCTIEAITGICDTVAQARADLAATFVEIGTAVEARGCGVACSGTHPFSHWRDQQVSPKDRYFALVDRLQWPARRLAIYGIHYHVGVPTGRHAVAIVNSLAYHLPQFLALSTSSPFWHGEDTGMASCRTKIFEGLPTAGLPPHLDDWRDFEAYMHTLIHAEAIQSVREVWWDVRPHPDFGTVELRMCDGMPTLDEIAAVAALAQCLVAELTERLDAGEPIPTAREWVVRQNKWLAARYGLGALVLTDDRGDRQPLDEVVSTTIDRLRPTADRLGCRTELEAAATIVARGPSSVRQRAIRDDGGSFADVVDSLLAEFVNGLPRPVPAGPAT